MDADAKQCADDLLRAKKASLTNIKEVIRLSKGTIEDYYPLEIVANVINQELSPTEPVSQEDFDSSKHGKQRLEDFKKVMHEHGAGDSIEYLKSLLGGREQGIETVDELLGSFDEESLSEFRRLVGTRMQRVGKKAQSIMRMARALSSGEEILIQTPTVPESPNYVMFDLEGLPPQLDEIDKIYLWGLQVLGNKPGDYISATAGFGEKGDQQGWEDFLEKAKRIFVY